MRVIRSRHHSEFVLADLAARKTGAVSVCVPTLNEIEHIDRALGAIEVAREHGLVDEVVVVDSGSTDGTVDRAAALGVQVHVAEDLIPQFGPLLGKGDAMWRALSVLSGDVVCFVDADTEQPDPRFVAGLVGPLVDDPAVEFVKACFRRPFRVGKVALPEGGGRVNELTARPLLRRFYPPLAELRQPLAGEIAARRGLLEALPFACGYAVEISMLIDAWHQVGEAGMVEVDLDERQNRHRPLSALAPMADAVLGAVAARLEREGRLAAGLGDAGMVERPPMASLRAPT